MNTTNRIIQASPPHTGSSLLLNLIHGFFLPDEPQRWCSERLIDDYFITKTHRLNINEWIEKYPQYNMYFVMSERDDNKVSRLICESDRQNKNVLIIDYNEFVESDVLSLHTIIDNIFDKFIKFFPPDMIPDKNHTEIKNNMMTRIENMNICVDKLKNEPFSIFDSFYGIHGNHRHRDVNHANYVFVSGKDTHDIPWPAKVKSV